MRPPNFAPPGCRLATMSSTAIAPKKVYVLDCGGQYAHLLASRVRKHEALSVIVDADTPVAELTGASASIVWPEQSLVLTAGRPPCRCWRDHRLRGAAVCVRPRFVDR